MYMLSISAACIKCGAIAVTCVSCNFHASSSEYFILNSTTLRILRL